MRTIQTKNIMTVETRRKLALAITISISAVLVLAFFVNPHSAHAEKLYAVLDPATGGSTYNTIKSVWNQILALINYAMVGVLLFIAFTNILRIDVSRYGIKKFLPTMLLAVILANFSWTICRLMIDFANIICDALIRGPGTGAGIDPGNKVMGIAESFNKFKPEYESFINSASGTFDWAQVFRLFILTAMEFVGAGVVLILAFLFLLRNYVIYFVVSISPLAFMSMVLPQTKKFYDQWWQNFMKWTFMPIVSLFWLWVGAKWIAPLTNTYSPFLAVVFGIVTYYMAITSPFKMGGSLMSSYSNWSKKAAGALGGTAAVNYAKKQGQVWWSNQGNSDNKLNPLAHIARAQALGKMKMDDMDKRVASNQDSVKGRLIEKTRFAQKITKGQDAMGGMEDLTREEVLAKHYENPDNIKGKAEYLERKAQAGVRMNQNLAMGKNDFFDTALGTEMLDAKLLYQKRTEEYQNRFAMKQAGVERDYYNPTGTWEQKGSEKWKIKQGVEEARKEKDKVEAAVKSLANDENLRGLAHEMAAFKLNGKDLAYQAVHEANEKIRNSTNIINTTNDAGIRLEHEKIVEEAQKDRLTAMKGAGVDVNDQVQVQAFINDAPNFLQKIAARKQALQDYIVREFGRDDKGKLNVPYALRPVIKLSDDGTTIDEIKGIDSLGAKGASRLNKLLGMAIEEESQGYDAKYSPEEMGHQLTHGGDDFKESDIKLYRAGRGSEVNPETLAKLIAMQRAYLKYANRDPRSLENMQFVNALPEVIAAGGPQETARIADRIQGELVRAQRSQKPNLTEQEARDAVESDELTKRQGRTDAEFITNIARSQKHRRAVTLVVGEDRYLGNSRPATESFAGTSSARSYSPSPDMNPQVYEASRQMSVDLSKAATGQISAIAKKFKQMGSASNASMDSVLSGAHSIIHQEKLKFANNFAKQIGLVANEAQLKPEDKDVLVRIMGKSVGKSSTQIAAMISRQFDDIKVTLPESAELNAKTEAATKIQTAIENLEKVKVADMVDEITAYIPSLATTAKEPNGRAILQALSTQAGTLSGKLATGAETDPITPEIASQAKAILMKTGRVSEDIDATIQDRNRLFQALERASKAAEVAASSTTATGDIDMNMAQEKLFQRFTKK